MGPLINNAAVAEMMAALKRLLKAVKSLLGASFAGTRPNFVQPTCACHRRRPSSVRDFAHPLCHGLRFARRAIQLRLPSSGLSIFTNLPASESFLSHAGWTAASPTSTSAPAA